MAKTRNFYFNRGEDVVIDETIEGSGSIASWSFSWTLRTSESEADTVAALVELTLGNGITIIDAANREVQISVDSDSLKSLGQNAIETEYFYDFWRTDAGNKAMLQEGKFVLGNAVTRFA